MPTAIKQFKNECSLAAVASLNNLSQDDYAALSSLVRGEGAVYYPATRAYNRLHNAIRIGLSVARQLGLTIPESYPGPGLTDCSPPDLAPDFSGKGLVRIKFILKRCRKFTHHVLVFEDGVFYESDGKAYPSWDALADDYKDAGSHDLTILKIFK